MRTFSVGDKVIVRQEIGLLCPKITKGMIGTICCFGEFGNPGVAFESDINGHTCGDKCEGGHGWFIREELLELVEIEMDADEDDLALFMDSIQVV